MKLIDAVDICRRAVREPAQELKVFLACGFTPLHLSTFLSAALRLLRPDDKIVVESGLFGDLAGNIIRAHDSAADSAVVAIEWSDLDPRLGIRTLGGWRPDAIGDIVYSATEAAARIEGGVRMLASRTPTVLCLPSLPLPPLFVTRPAQAGLLEMNLRKAVASVAASLSECSGVQVASPGLLSEMSPPGERYDVKSDVLSGFPYSLRHASAVGELFANLIHKPEPKKGLITDLDDTIWSGIVGEDGVDGISWSLERGHMHGLYQQFAAALAGAGVLIAVASKNDPAIVMRAFDRSDLLLSKEDVFPVETGWSRKSDSIQRILKAWNIGPDAVVFVDDSPMEVAEVKSAFPEMECLVFPKDDYKAIWDLLKHLRDVFGKPVVTGDDSIRLQSLRSAAGLKDTVGTDGHSVDHFLKECDARLVIERVEASDARAFELVNKTNQFNLNGKRIGEVEWRRMVGEPASLAFSVCYRDKYGPLGKVAVLLGRRTGRRCSVHAWVMSCRAFSRRIEHQCLKYLFESHGVDEIEFDYDSTARNGPLREFLAELSGRAPAPSMIVTKREFEARVPLLFHRIEARNYV